MVLKFHEDPTLSQRTLRACGQTARVLQSCRELNSRIRFEHDDSTPHDMVRISSDLSDLVPLFPVIRNWFHGAAAPPKTLY